MQVHQHDIPDVPIHTSKLTMINGHNQSSINDIAERGDQSTHQGYVMAVNGPGFAVDAVDGLGNMLIEQTNFDGQAGVR